MKAKFITTFLASALCIMSASAVKTKGKVIDIHFSNQQVATLDVADIDHMEVIDIPEAYFNGNGNGQLAVCDQVRTLFIPVFRFSCDDEASVLLDVNFTTANGGAVSSDAFIYSKEVNFRYGETTTQFGVTANLSALKEGETYHMTLAVQDAPDNRFVTKVEYNILYLSNNDWTDIPNCTLADFAAQCMFASGASAQWPVQVQYNKSCPYLYRIYKPYASSPFSYTYVDNPDEVPTYLYLNASNPKRVFICDAAGNPQGTFNTGLYYDQTNVGIQCGYVTFYCGHSYYLKNTDMIIGSYVIPYNSIDVYAGRLTATTNNPGEGIFSGEISFDRSLFVTAPDLASSYGYWTAKKWKLFLNNTCIANQPYNLYLRGDMNFWDAEEAWQFKTTDQFDVYQLTNITIPAGARFKVSDNEWYTYYGIPGTSIPAEGFANLQYTGNEIMLEQDFHGTVQVEIMNPDFARIYFIPANSNAPAKTIIANINPQARHTLAPATTK